MIKFTLKKNPVCLSIGGIIPFRVTSDTKLLKMGLITLFSLFLYLFENSRVKRFFILKRTLCREISREYIK